MSAPSPLRRRLAAGLLAAAALALMLASLGHGRGEEARRRATLALLDSEAMLDLPAEVVEAVRREPDPAWQKLVLARALVAGEIDSPPPTAAGTEQGQAAAERLEQARTLAADALAERPAAWQAPMLRGAATYLLWSRQRDPRLFTAAAEWERPLEMAVALAPGKHEPGRFLATAYLELWPSVSEAKRETARELLATAFEDLRIFSRLAETWLEAAESREELFAPMPPDSGAWRHLERLFARRGDLDGFQEAWRGRREAVAREAAADLEEAEARLAGGDPVGARTLFLRAATRHRPGLEGLPVLLAALERAPPGTAGSFARPLADWLEWALDLCLLDRCPLPPATLERLAGLAGERSPPEAALAALAAGRLAEAESLERRSTALWHADWGPYLIVKSRRLVERGEPQAARAALDGVHPAWRLGTVYWQARQRVAAATGDEAGIAAAEAEIAGRTVGWWPAHAWDRSGPADRLEMLVAGEAAGVAVEVGSVAVGGAVIEVRLDGGHLGLFAVAPGDDLRARARLPPGFHRLEVETLAGERVLPGAAALIAG